MLNKREESRARPSRVDTSVVLEAPVVLDAVNGTLDPNLPGVKIRIPQSSSIGVEMAIETIWKGRRADLTTYEPKLEWHFPNQDEIDNGIVIVVEGKHVKEIEGGILKVWYNVLSDSNGEVIRWESKHAAPLQVVKKRQ